MCQLSQVSLNDFQLKNVITQSEKISINNQKSKIEKLKLHLIKVQRDLARPERDLIKIERDVLYRYLQGTALINSANDNEQSNATSNDTHEPSSSSNNSYEEQGNQSGEVENLTSVHSNVTVEKSNIASETSDDKCDPAGFSLADFIPSQSSSTVRRQRIRE